LWQRLSRNGSAKLCVSSFVEPAVLLLKSPACILPHDLFRTFQFTSFDYCNPFLFSVYRERRSTLHSIPPQISSFGISTTLNKAHATTPEICHLSSNHTSTSYRAFRTIPACEACPPPTYDWLDISPSKLQLSCSCSRLASTAPLLAYYNRFLFPAAPASFRLSLNQ
jgi:hypothetical protein